MKLILAITGASGTNLAKKFIEYLPNDIELHIITSKHAKVVEAFEEKKITLHSIDIDLNYEFAYNNMGVAYFQKEIDKTMELYTKVLQINPDDYKVWQKRLDLILNYTNYKSLN